MYKNALKEDLIRVVEDLDGTVESTDTIAKLKTKIEKSSTFESDPDFVKTLIKNCIDERVSRNEREATLEKQKIELAKLQLAQLEKEVELQTAKNKALNLNPAAKVEEKQFETNIENMIKSIKTLSLPVPTRSENFNLFFQSLELAFLTKKINDEYKSEILINLLGERAHNVLLYIKKEELNDYEKLKSIVLREFQLTPRECLNSFKNAVKSSGETYIQFAARLTANFQYYCSLRKVNSFESLYDLIISDKLFETLNKETATHIGIREAEDWLRPVDLAKESAIFIFHLEADHYLERQNKNCYICGDSSHYARDCEKRFKLKESNGHIHNRKNANTLKVKSEKQNDEFAQLQYVNIFVENQPVTALIDSGCQIPVLNSSLIRVNKPSEERITLSSCFGEQRMVEVKPINISLNQHSPSLSVRTAISLTLTEEFIIHPSVYTEIKKLSHAKSDVLLSESGSSLGAYSGAYSNSIFYVANVIENSSYDLSHVKNFNIRNDLSSLIKNYKPNKIKSTKLKMNIILKDDIPVCQRARRLSCSEKLQVDDQIDDWLQQGIIKESVSDYCSPIVLCKKKDGNLRICIDYRKINSKTEKDRYPLPLIEEVLDQLQSGNFFSTIDLKNGFFHVEMEENRHIIEKGTIKPSLDKTKAVQNFPEPKNVKQVQSFLGLSGYFRKFIQNYSIIAKPLSDLLRDNTVFHFGPEQQLAFQTLRQKLSENPVLHIFKQGAKLELHTDASKFGYGAILLQQSDDNKLHPVHYFSKKTTPQEEKYSSYELEVLAVIESLKKFRNYLVGNKFKIVTDCSAFQKTMSKKQLTSKIARWALFLEDFNYEIIHRPGKQMRHVDCLSRYPVMTITYDEITTKLANCQRNDEYINSLKTLLENKQIIDFVVKNDVLYKIENDSDVLVVPQQMQTEIVKNIHSKGHLGINKTESMVKQSFYFTNVRKCVENVINNCIECILVNKKRGKGEGLLNPIPEENIPLSTYHIDFLGPLPSTNKNYNHILSIIDAFTKFVWLYPVKSTFSRDALEKLKQQEVTFGNPHRIITDKGTAFTSKEFREYCENENIQQLSITTGIPRGNGQIERIHSSLIPILSKLSIDDASKWFKFVPAVQRTLNSTISRSTQMTPFQLLTGVKMRTKQDLEILKLLEEVNRREIQRKS
ncbi:transposon Tf2-9 polyprotein [Trichonephila clavipes]|nr:transposon Tf2-9 polyprotein [Trichonephila clavipes]